MIESRPTVLIIDDTDANRYALRRFVEQGSYTAVEGGTGHEAIELAERHFPDVIVLDVNLPDTDGFTVCGQLKANPRTAHIPVIQVSASFIGAKDRVKGLQGGADAYLTQPVEPMVLLATIDAVLRAHRVERELRRAQLQLRAALDAAGMETFSIDWQEQRMSRFTESELLAPNMDHESMALEDFIARVHPDDRAGLTGHFANAIAKQGRYEAEFRVILDGKTYWRLERGQAVGDRTGTTPQLIGVSMDITERKALTEALMQADRRKDEFLAMLAHELRNPLAPIRNAAQVLDQLIATGNGAKSMVAVIHRQVNHMARLVDDLLDVSRITRGKIELKPEPVLIASVVDYAVETTRPLIDTLKHELVLDVAQEPLCVNGDFARLGQSLANILSNAAKYTEPRGRIELSAQREGDDAIIKVKDNGIGIPRELLPHVFEMFMQGDRALDRSQGGLGIGLALVKSLISFHHGSVAVHSDGPGCGSEFTVRLPLAAQPPSVKIVRDPTAPDGTHRRVLIVDDNRDSADSMAALLRFSDHDVHVAHTGPAALHLAAECEPEVIFLDIGLPGMNGLEVVRRLRELPQSRRARIVAVTGYGQPDDMKRSLDAGFDQHLVKPLDPAAVQRILDS